MRSIIALFALLFLVLNPTVHAAQRNLAVTKSAGEQKRVALVIGNAAYQGTSPLKNPVNDAHAMSDALNKLGFQVIEVTDATQKEMNRAIAEFGGKLNGETAALFFYAGHGLQVKNKNYLVPVDAQINGEAAVRAETVDVDAVMDQLNASPVSIVILDACRNNPFERSFRKMGGGLAQMDAPKGSFIAYATAPGKTAADGDGKNGLFTQELLKQINEPGLTLEGVFKRVRANVSKTTGDAQMPWDSSSMTGDFYFKPGDGTQVASLVPVPVQPVHIKSKEEIEQDAWNSAEASNTLEAVNAYLSSYPKGRYIAQAKIKLVALKAEASKPQPEPAPIADKTGQTFRDCPDCPEMVKIPGRNYAIGKYHVTHGEFAKFVSETNYDAGNDCNIWNGSGWEKGEGWRNPGFKKDDSHPVVCVNWNDAMAYVQWLSRKTSRNYMLPTESEWEAACYAGNQTEYCGGNNIDFVAWYEDNSGGHIHPVGQKQPNSYGLYDMSGNAWQWMESWYNNEQKYRALRGGSWDVRPQLVRTASRGYFTPDTRINGVGFRLAMTLDAPSPATVGGSRQDAESVLWGEAQKGNSKEDYQVYLNQYPNGTYSELAKSRINKLENMELINLKVSKPNGFIGSALIYRIEVDGKKIGDISNGQFVSTRLRPGNYMLSAYTITKNGARDKCNLQVELKNGEVWYELGMGWTLCEIRLHDSPR